MSVHGYYVGEFEYHLIQFIVTRLADHMLVLDVGAHHGEFALPIAYEFKRRQWSSRVWSFEPEPENAACLRYNLAANDLVDYADLFGVAVSDAACEAAELLCPADNSSNTLASNAAYAIGDELPTVRRRRVETIRLDDMDFGSWTIGIVKLDIQGSEPEALRGAAATLKRHRPILVIEVVESWQRAGEVRQILDELGYAVHGLTKSGEMVHVHDPTVFVSWDWIAVPRSQIAVEKATGRPVAAAAKADAPVGSRVRVNATTRRN